MGNPEPIETTLFGRTVTYSRRPSTRARYFRLWASPQTGLVVTVPAHREHDAAGLDRFLRRHARWIVRQADWLDGCAARAPKRWPYGPTLPYCGEEHPVVVEPTRRRSEVERTVEGRLVVRMRQPGVEGARRLLKRWFLGEALRRLDARVRLWGGQVGVGWRRVTVRDQRRRWGSCSSTGCLSFNYRLIMAPPAVLDYVVIHELAHRCHLNHSERFWALVASHCPDYAASLAWLKSHGPYLGV